MAAFQGICEQSKEVYMSATATAFQPDRREPWTPSDWIAWIVAATVVFFAIATLLSMEVALLTNNIGGSLMFGVLLILYLSDSFHVAKAETVEKVIPKLWKKYVNVLLGPGMIYIPAKHLTGSLFGWTTVNGKEQDLSFSVKERVAQDKGEVEAVPYINYFIDPSNPEKFMEVGQFEGVNLRLLQWIDKWLRDWVLSKAFGPQTVDDARAMNQEAMNWVLERLFAGDIEAISPDIPNEAILGFVKSRTPTTKEIELKTIFDKKEVAERSRILQEGKELLSFIEGVRDGEVSVKMSTLGIVITRFGVGDFKPCGKTATFMDQVYASEAEREKRVKDAKGLAEAATHVANVPGMNSDPVQTLLIAEGKIKKEIKETEFRLPDNILTGMQVLLGPLSQALASKIAGNASPASKEAPRLNP